MKNYIKEYALYIIFIISFAGMAGSLYASEIEGLIPCGLCYWQRVWLYPTVLISAVGIVKKDISAFQYILPINIVGTLFALYHNIMQNVPAMSENLTCSGGISCSNPTMLFDLGNIGVSVEFLSLISFMTINILIGLFYFVSKKK